MKKLFAHGIVFLIAVILLTACTANEVIYTNDEPDDADSFEPLASEVAEDMLVFSSMDDLFAAHRLVRTGEDITHLVANWTSTVSEPSLMGAVESTNFAALEKFYVPTGIPEYYRLYRIDISNEWVSIWYVLDEYFPTDENAIFFGISDQPHFQNQPHFQFSFSRWELDSPMDSVLQQMGLTERDLIDGKYLFREPNLFLWAVDREQLMLYIPLPEEVRQAIAESYCGSEMAEIFDEFNRRNHPKDLLRFTETKVINLVDYSSLSDTSIDETNPDFVYLKNTSYFATSGIGFGLYTPDGIYAFGRLFQNENALEYFQKLESEASSAGRLYALSALFFLDYENYTYLIEDFRYLEETVNWITGCIILQGTSVNELILRENAVRLRDHQDRQEEYSYRYGLSHPHIDFYGGGIPHAVMDLVLNIGEE